jgi:hypothetical protein
LSGARGELTLVRLGDQIRGKHNHLAIARQRDAGDAPGAVEREGIAVQVTRSGACGAGGSEPVVAAAINP